MRSNNPDPLSSRRQGLSRFMLAGPVVLLASIIVMAGAPVWFPAGAAGINSVAVPLVLYPLIWAGLFFYACLSQKLKRAWLVISAIVLLNTVIILWHLQILF